MTTPLDLLIVALNLPSRREIGQGDLSLALAGAELLDLADAGVLTVEDDRLVPGTGQGTGDRLLDEAAAALVRRPPYETAEDWLWRRGRGLAQAYVAVLEQETPAGGGHRHWLRRRSEPATVADSPPGATRTSGGPPTSPSWWVSRARWASRNRPRRGRATPPAVRR
ncbi:hypothetical protein GCM10020295_23690 [Streptomyces cinereospinus]